MSEPRSLRALLSGWRPAGERTPLGGEAGALAGAWPDAVGPDVARRTRTSSFRDGSLTIITPSSAWSHQLTFLAPTIIERLRSLCPDVAVQRLRFVVATGRSRALLGSVRKPEEGARSRAVRVQSRPLEAGSDVGALDATASSGDDLEGALARLRAQQQQLDAQRLREGWVRCDVCGCWSRTRRCEPCAQEASRAADARVASALVGAPWLTHAEVAADVPDADRKRYERVRRTLLAAWQQQLFNAKARLRRNALEAADRVVAWSYAMLFAQRRKGDVSDAVLANVLGPDWADALRAGPNERGARAAAAVSARKAPRPAREK